MDEVKFQENLLAAGKLHMATKDGNEWNPKHQNEKEKLLFSQTDLDLLHTRFVGIKDHIQRLKEERQKVNSFGYRIVKEIHFVCRRQHLPYFPPTKYKIVNKRIFESLLGLR